MNSPPSHPVTSLILPSCEQDITSQTMACTVRDAAPQPAHVAEDGFGSISSIRARGDLVKAQHRFKKSFADLSGANRFFGNVPRATERIAANSALFDHFVSQQLHR